MYVARDQKVKKIVYIKKIKVTTIHVFAKPEIWVNLYVIIFINEVKNENVNNQKNENNHISVLNGETEIK